MDIISVNCRHAGTFHLVSPPAEADRKDAYSSTRARRGNRQETLAADRNGEIGGGLDVYEHEPAINPETATAGEAGKVTLLPHMAPATIEGRGRDARR